MIVTKIVKDGKDYGYWFVEPQHNEWCFEADQKEFNNPIRTDYSKLKCPKCGYIGEFETTCIGCVGLDKSNKASCMKCSWRGMVSDCDPLQLISNNT
jgi:hypothetical protein